MPDALVGRILTVLSALVRGASGAVLLGLACWGYRIDRTQARRPMWALDLLGGVAARRMRLHDHAGRPMWALDLLGGCGGPGVGRLHPPVATFMGPGPAFGCPP